jgi:hypothetical protein
MNAAARQAHVLAEAFAMGRADPGYSPEARASLAP